MTSILFCCLLGKTTSSGNFPSKICLETQHFMLDEQILWTSKMASQNPESLSATQTPGHFLPFEVNSEVSSVYS